MTFTTTLAMPLLIGAGGSPAKFCAAHFGKRADLLFRLARPLTMVA
jgi:hypothetical protein